MKDSELAGGAADRTHTGTSIRSLLVRNAARVLAKPAVGVWMARPDLAWPLTLVDDTASLLPKPSGAEYADVDLGSCSAEWVHAESKNDEQAVLYLHGGAFLMGGLNTHRPLAVTLSERADCPVLNVDYRMLPSAPVAHAVEDAVRGYEWLCDKGYDGEDIVIAGDSAGGYLAFMTALALAEAKLPKPAGILALSPLVDTDVDRRAGRGRHTECPLFPEAAVDSLVDYIETAQTRLVVNGDAALPICPLDNDLSVLPPVMIHAGEDELLRTDAEAMTEEVRASGGQCELHLWRNQVHAFPVLADALPESRRALRIAGRFVKTVTRGEDPAVIEPRHRRSPEQGAVA
ncbi:alpha/beta hydrolase [Rhodococcus sp. SJ-3]|uniref:alpha/beta hydrolase n=1 Tax=Rhodococcus sp. SJ-3 TaxID=3454628 RepID=UPI003F7AE103